MNTEKSRIYDSNVTLYGDYQISSLDSLVKLEDDFYNYGKTLKEWNTKPDGTGISYQPNQIIQNLSDDIVLYAIWN